jgi:transposase
MGYQGKKIKDFSNVFKKELEIVKRPSKWFRVQAEVIDVTKYLEERGHKIVKGFQVLPRRWVVERTFAWIGRFRRSSKDYEYLTETSEAILYAIMCKILLKRLENA